MRVLVTGATGFVGGWMVERLLAQSGWRPFGIGRRNDWPEDLAHLRHVPLAAIDWDDPETIASQIRAFGPDAIIHLAGYASAGKSFREPEAAWWGNFSVTRSLFLAIESSGLRPRILHVGTGLVYAPPEGEALLDECAPLGPASPYAASKLAGDFLARREGERLGLEVVVARPLNHIGPRQDPQFALASFARQIARMEKGLQPPVLETGNLSPARDLSDVRDIVEGYYLLIQNGRPNGVYNLGSGHALRMGDVLDHLLRHARVKVDLVTRGDLLRPGEPEVFRADTTKLRRDTKWSPRYGLEETLSDLLAWCRETVA